MNKYYINVTIYNDFGELAEKKFGFDSHDEMLLSLGCSADMQDLIETSRKYANENNMMVEEMYDGSSKVDLITSDEKFQ